MHSWRIHVPARWCTGIHMYIHVHVYIYAPYSSKGQWQKVLIYSTRAQAKPLSNWFSRKQYECTRPLKYIHSGSTLRYTCTLSITTCIYHRAQRANHSYKVPSPLDQGFFLNLRFRNFIIKNPEDHSCKA